MHEKPSNNFTSNIFVFFFVSVLLNILSISQQNDIEGSMKRTIYNQSIILFVYNIIQRL